MVREEKTIVIKFKMFNVASKENRAAAIRRAKKKYKTLIVRSAWFSSTLKKYIVQGTIERKK